MVAGAGTISADSENYLAIIVSAETAATGSETPHVPHSNLKRHTTRWGVCAMNEFQRDGEKNAVIKKGKKGKKEEKEEKEEKIVNE